MNARRPEVILIAAVARSGVIGRDNALPWRLKADLQHFRAVTLGHPLLMGRKTWESLGRPLPGRRNMVISRSPEFRADEAEVFPSADAALAAVGEHEKVFVIGGAEVYRLTLPVADRLMLTEVWADVAGDAHFPPIDSTRFIEERREPHEADADNEHAFDFVEYRRQGTA
ncbi:MAG: dihydrofolate reductase [Proteobacteria bacterium]|nr:dihydrofolate reductase [Pseudomonadota bacterium]